MVGFIFQKVIRQRYFAWWSRLNYLTSKEQRRVKTPVLDCIMGIEITCFLPRHRVKLSVYSWDIISTPKSVQKKQLLTPRSSRLRIGFRVSIEHVVHILCFYYEWYRRAELVGKHSRLYNYGCSRYRCSGCRGRRTAFWAYCLVMGNLWFQCL